MIGIFFFVIPKEQVIHGPSFIAGNCRLFVYFKIINMISRQRNYDAVVVKKIIFTINSR